jgi:hypothetical protein
VSFAPYSLVHRYSLELVHGPRAHLHQAMPMPD